LRVKVEEPVMARGQKPSNDDLLIDNDLAAAFLNDDDQAVADDTATVVQEETWEEDDAAMPGQLAVDVYETETSLVVKARTAGVNKQDLDVSISDGVLTISGTLSSGDESDVVQWHVQECYWGEFSRSIALPIPVKEDEVNAVLQDGVLSVGFTKIKQEQARKIQIQ
jgi:HSP20 family protein